MFLETNRNNREMSYQILQRCIWYNQLHNIFYNRQLQIEDFLEEEDYNSLSHPDKEIPMNPVFLSNSNVQKCRPIRPIPIIQKSIPSQQPAIQQNNYNNQNKTTKIQRNCENNNDIIVKQNLQNRQSNGRQVQLHDGNNFENIQLEIQHLRSVLNFQRGVVMNARMVNQEYSAMIKETSMLLQRYENKLRSIKCSDYQHQFQGHDVTPPLSPTEQRSIINGTLNSSAEQSPPSAHQSKSSIFYPHPVSTIVSPILQTPPAYQNSSDLSIKFKFDQATPETLLSPTAGGPGYILPGVIQRPQFSPNNIPKSISLKPLRSNTPKLISPKRSPPSSTSPLSKKLIVSQNKKSTVTYFANEPERNLKVS